MSSSARHVPVLAKVIYIWTSPPALMKRPAILVAILANVLAVVLLVRFARNGILLVAHPLLLLIICELLFVLWKRTWSAFELPSTGAAALAFALIVGVVIQSAAYRLLDRLLHHAENSGGGLAAVPIFLFFYILPLFIASILLLVILLRRATTSLQRRLAFVIGVAAIIYGASAFVLAIVGGRIVLVGGFLILVLGYSAFIWATRSVRSQ